MPVRRNVSITPEQDAPLKAILRFGRYRSISETMRAASRLLERDEAAALADIRAPGMRHEAGRA